MCRHDGRTPHDLAAESNVKIRETLALADIDIDVFTSPDNEYDHFVQRFFESLYEGGQLARRTYSFPYSKSERHFLVEGFATGCCPQCYAGTCGAICENCGHPNDVESLLLTTGHDGDVEHRDVEVAVLELERHRERFARLYERQRSTMRPHVLRFVDEMLAEPLPDFPLTYPVSWGIPATFGGLRGQVINVWGEMLPALMWMTAAAQKLAPDPCHMDDLWAKNSGYELVQFLGYDNTFYFTFAHPALGFAAGGLLEPTAIVTNEFLHLDGHKFSTSRGHVVWARDLIESYGVDNVRFYLALNNPEHQRANFTANEFDDVVRRSLHAPLAQIADALAADAGALVAISADDIASFDRFGIRMLRAYSVDTLSLREAADTLANVAGMLAAAARRSGDDRTLPLITVGLHEMASYAAPLMPGFAARLTDQLAVKSQPGLARTLQASELPVPKLEPAALLQPI